MGTAVGYSYTYYLQRQYHKCVDETYDMLKDKFATNPILSTIKEDY
jgi:hypothetical protein